MEFDFLPVSEFEDRMLLYVITHQPALRPANDKSEIPITKSQYVVWNIRILMLEFGAWNLGFEIIDCIFEYEQTVTLTILVVLQVIGMLDIGNVPFRMGHETENPPRAVGDAGNAQR